MNSIYKRVIIKLSGESLSDSKNSLIYDSNKLKNVASVIKEIVSTGTQVGIVVGAGNIWRGRLAEKIGIDHSTADYMGMLGTIMNALAIQSAIEDNGVACRVMSSINVPQVCEPYIRRKAMTYLDKGIVTIFAGGTGNPYFTTDTTSTLRALEVEADAILMAKNGVDGVYDSDPRKNKDVHLIKKLAFHEVVEKQLQVMDLTAVAMLENTDVIIRVFNMDDTSSFMKVLTGEDIGTTISRE
mgnify:FL=1